MKKIALVIATSLLLTACGGGADKPEKREEVQIPVNLACDEGMSEYRVAGTPIQFCYDPAWGTVTTHENPGQAGQSIFVEFDGTGKSPAIHYQSLDYVAPESATEQFCYECLVINAPNDVLTGQVAGALGVGEDKVNVRKADVGGKKAVRVHANYVHSMLGATDTVTYYVPEPFDGYTMEVYGDNEIATEVDDFVYDIVL